MLATQKRMMIHNTATNQASRFEGYTFAGNSLIWLAGSMVIIFYLAQAGDSVATG